MLDVKEFEREKRMEKARNLRYKKAIAIGMNMYDIRQWLDDTGEALEDVAYTTQNEDVFLNAFDGDEEEAFEYRVAFSSLAADVERFRDDLERCWVPECFDDFFCACAGRGFEYAGFDSVEQDYFGLDDFEDGLAQTEARKRLERLTKKDLIEAAHRCFQIAIAYLGLKGRRDDLQAALDILRAQNKGLLHGIREIEELYEKWSEAEFENKEDIGHRMDAIAAQLPEEVWLR